MKGRTVNIFMKPFEINKYILKNIVLQFVTAVGDELDL